jgi:hypothetical protein
MRLNMMHNGSVGDKNLLVLHSPVPVSGCGTSVELAMQTRQGNDFDVEY